MKRLIVALILALIPSLAHASGTKPIPASLYPKHVVFVVHKHETNDKFLCEWSFECDSAQPVWHTQTPDDLHRVGGWMQAATRKNMAFALFYSTYEDGTNADGTAYSTAAYNDLDLALKTSFAVDFPAATPKGTELQDATPPNGEILFHRAVKGESSLTICAVWFGTTEIEAAVAIDKHSLPQYRATQFLLSQVTAAEHMSS